MEPLGNALMLNYLALLTCILSELTPEQALRRFFPYMKNINYPAKRAAVKEQDTEEMIKLRETMSYKQIGELFGISDATVYERIKKYKQTRISK